MMYLFPDGEVALKVAAAYYEPYKKIYNEGVEYPIRIGQAVFPFVRYRVQC